MNYRILYDADCPICCREMAHIRARNPKGNLFPMALQNHRDILAAHGVDPDEAMVMLHMIDDEGKVYSGMPAFRIIYRENGWRLLATLLSLPGVRQFSEWLYPIFARHRYQLPAWLLPKQHKKMRCQDGQCQR